MIRAEDYIEDHAEDGVYGIRAGLLGSALPPTLVSPSTRTPSRQGDPVGRREEPSMGRARGSVAILDDGWMLADVVEHLICPVCRGHLELQRNALQCPAGHSFDIARQGYANLLSGDVKPGTADTPEMVRARDAFLSAGHFAPLTRLLGERVSDGLLRALGENSGGGELAGFVVDAGRRAKRPRPRGR